MGNCLGEEEKAPLVPQRGKLKTYNKASKLYASSLVTNKT
jgi:hypothetical protein